MTVLVLKTPCHQRKLRIEVTPFVARERFERVCRSCGFAWTIERRTLRTDASMRMDAIDWTAASRIGIPS